MLSSIRAPATVIAAAVTATVIAGQLFRRKSLAAMQPASGSANVYSNVSPARRPAGFLSRDATRRRSAHLSPQAGRGEQRRRTKCDYPPACGEAREELARFSVHLP